MRNFVITTIPTGNYKEIEQVGDRYVVHLEPAESDSMTTCYECMADTSDVEQLTADLQAWKARREVLATTINNKERMREIQAELAATDYLALKAFEGEDMSEHPTWRENRAALRAEYNRLEAANLALASNA